MQKNYIPPKIHSGFTAMEMLGALLIIMLATLFATEKFYEYMQEKEWSVMARHATSFNEAAKSYIADNSDSLLASVPAQITPALLINKGYLQSGFSTENSYGQSYVTGVVKNTTLNAKLQALTCSINGSEIPYSGLRSISTQIEGLGGYVDKDKVATGAFGGWTSNTLDFGIACTTGHIAIALSSEVLGTAMQESDRLYRYQVNGRPDLNRMHTSIDMGANNLNNTDTVNAQTGNFKQNVTGQNVTAKADVTGDRIIGKSTVWSDGWIGANGDIRSNGGWLISKHGKGWLNEDHGGGFYMDDNDWIRSVNNKGIYTGGQLKGGTVRADGRASVGEYLQLDGIANAGWGCSPNGLISRDASGAVLSCQNGVWTASGKLKDFQMVSGGDACGRYNFSNAYCPAGKQLISGGYILSRWGGDGWNAPDLTKPTADGNGWQIYTGGGIVGGSCIQAIAWCANN
jgi:hypothetical protein